jgi:hypothetical protein
VIRTRAGKGSDSGRVGAERRERMRSRLLSSALQLVGAQGPAAMSIDEYFPSATGAAAQGQVGCWGLAFGLRLALAGAVSG